FSVVFLVACPVRAFVSPLSLHDALPIWVARCHPARNERRIVQIERDLWPFMIIRRIRSRASDHDIFRIPNSMLGSVPGIHADARSEEHTSELQSREKLVCRLLLEKKKTK